MILENYLKQCHEIGGQWSESRLNHVVHSGGWTARAAGKLFTFREADRCFLHCSSISHLLCSPVHLLCLLRPFRPSRKCCLQRGRQVTVEGSTEQRTSVLAGQGHECVLDEERLAFPHTGLQMWGGDACHDKHCPWGVGKQ